MMLSRAASDDSTMTGPADLNPHIIEALYSEALLLADEVRAAFDLSGRLDRASENEDLARIAMSCEALRTTTRMMHVIAWLLNQRAYFAGELENLKGAGFEFFFNGGFGNDGDA